jgi:hypothetical protein
MGHARLVRERRRGLMSALRKLPHVREQLQQPGRATASVKVKARALVAFMWLRRYWPWLVILAIVILGGSIRSAGSNGR